jgi:Xaa-Pro aminopeptidase
MPDFQMGANRVEDLLISLDLDALVVFNGINLRYLCGFTGTDGALILMAGSSCFLTDSRYMTQAGQQVRADEIIEYKSKLEGVTDHLKNAGVRRIGFEADHLSYSQVEQLRKFASPEMCWVPVGKPIQKLRSRKSQAEVEHLEAATALAAQAFETIIPLIQPGRCESEIALELEFAMRRAGGEEKAFDIIVASGARGALPHGVASKKLLQEGELLTIDYGVRYNGYHSDETVTLALGNISSKMRRIFDIVLAAHDLAIDKVRPGVSLAELDASARDYIVSEGYGQFFGHGLGHGVGLEIHEYPAISSRAEDLIEEGMVITIEPGIYLPGEGGVRIEDMLYVTADGCRILTQLPKKFCNILQ